MDISNATAAGPSEGLLDLIFGSKSKEAESGDGKGFDALMNLVKALNKNDKEEGSQDLSRTDKGTGLGKGEGDSLANLVSNQNAAAQEERQMRDRMAALQAIALLPPTAAVTPQAPLPKLDSEQVNRVLQDNSLPQLSQSELKLLDSVNAKVDEANLSHKFIMGGSPAEAEAPQAAPMANAALDGGLARELARKGVDARDIKGVETQGVAPEKFLSTESYLKMHESFGKGAAKEAEGSNRDLADAPQAGPSRGVHANQNLVGSAVQEAGGKEKDLFGRAHHELADKLPGAGRKGQAPVGGAFASELLQQLDGNRAGGELKNVYLPAKPEQMRPVLLNEVETGVQAQAVKGGGEMRLVIHPPELGQVTLKVGAKNGKVEVEVGAENSKVADMIRGGSQELENSLKDQNLALTKFEVTVADNGSAPLTAGSEAKNSTNDQFLSQNQNGFGQMGRDDGGFSRWDGSQQSGGRDSGFGSFAAEDRARSTAAAKVKNMSTTASRDSSRRLDVVA